MTDQILLLLVGTALNGSYVYQRKVNNLTLLPPNPSYKFDHSVQTSYIIYNYLYRIVSFAL